MDLSRPWPIIWWSRATRSHSALILQGNAGLLAGTLAEGRIVLSPLARSLAGILCRMRFYHTAEVKLIKSHMWDPQMALLACGSPPWAEVGELGDSAKLQKDQDPDWWQALMNDDQLPPWSLLAVTACIFSLVPVRLLIPSLSPLNNLLQTNLSALSSFVSPGSY